MRWPWRYKGSPVDREGKELAKRQLEIAKVIEAESHEAAHEHRWLLFNNHFGPNADEAFAAARLRRGDR